MNWMFSTVLLTTMSNLGPVACAAPKILMVIYIFFKKNVQVFIFHVCAMNVAQP